MKQILDLCVTMTIVAIIVGIGAALFSIWPVVLTLVIITGVITLLVRGIVAMCTPTE